MKSLGNALRTPQRFFVVGVFCLAVLMSGCGWMSSGDEEQAAAEAVPTAESVEPPVPQAPRQKLVLSLEPGQRFPLLKTVSQTLMQGTSVSRSWLELLMVLTVEEVMPSDDPRAELAGRRRLGVRYQRVRYSHDIAGHRVVYNSTDSGREIPVDALPWHGLVNNSFSFWIGPDNQLVELVGFDEFLARCVRDVPAEHRRQVIETLGETASQKHEGVANLVDDSIGMLPAGSGADGGAWLTPGDRWTRERHVVRPIPMSLSNTYVLTQLTDQYAEIDVSGTIGAGVTFGPLAEQYSRVSVKVRGGQTAGVCRIDRRTGLPIHSQIDRTIQMSATAPDGSAFDQTKHIRSTIEVFQPGGDVRELAGPPRRGDLNGPGEAREKPRQEIIPAGAESGSGAVRQAVYSDSPDAVQRPQ